MWRTPVGVRCLKGAEADLFQTTAGVYQGILLDMAGAGANPPMPNGDRWQHLPWEQQMIAIGLVTHDLLSPLSEAPPLFAWNELTIHQVFCFLRDIEDPEYFGKLILKAAKQCKLPGAARRKKGELSLIEYERFIGLLRSRALEDREIDREMIQKVKRGGLEAVGLRDDYFAQLFPAFSVERLESALLNEERFEEAVSLLPNTHLTRHLNGMNVLELDAVPWCPPVC